jgi:hypothetical protein
MKPATLAPYYCAIYPQIAEIARSFGYAAAIHGSMSRDFDIIFIPWVKDAGEPDDLINKLLETFAMTKAGEQDIAEHGRIRYGMSLMGDCFFDLSFMPRISIKE